jgi:Lar family restriction alleviation protein
MKPKQEYKWDIKPCPYCGSIAGDGVDVQERDDQLREFIYAVVCDSCEAQGPMAAGAFGAIHLWNLVKRKGEK